MFKLVVHDGEQDPFENECVAPTGNPAAEKAIG
jgi:hypothetical protein